MVFVKFPIDQIRQAIRGEKLSKLIIDERKWLKNIASPICVCQKIEKSSYTREVKIFQFLFTRKSNRS